MGVNITVDVTTEMLMAVMETQEFKKIKKDLVLEAIKNNFDIEEINTLEKRNAFKLGMTAMKLIYKKYNLLYA